MGRIQAAEIETEIDEIDEMPPPVQSPDGDAPAEEARTQPGPGETSDPSKVSEVSQVHSVEGTGVQTSAELGGGAPSRAADRAGRDTSLRSLAHFLRLVRRRSTH